jgi:hypothetical protein
MKLDEDEETFDGNTFLVGNLTALHWVDLTDFTCNTVFCGVDSEPTFVCKKKNTFFGWVRKMGCAWLLRK